jgi:hypothetical protein
VNLCEPVEKLLPLSELAKLIPARDGRPIRVGTVRQWTLRGVRGVRLEAVRVGGRKMVSREALRRFVEATTLAASVSPRTADV